MSLLSTLLVMVFSASCRGPDISLCDPCVQFERVGDKLVSIISFTVQNPTSHTIHIFPDDFGIFVALHYSDGNAFSVLKGQISLNTANIPRQSVSVEPNSKHRISISFEEDNHDLPPEGAAKLFIWYRCFPYSEKNKNSTINDLKLGPVEVMVRLAENGVIHVQRRIESW